MLSSNLTVHQDHEIVVNGYKIRSPSGAVRKPLTIGHPPGPMVDCAKKRAEIIPMGATILSGKETAASVRNRIRDTVASHMAAGGRRPCLAVILVGNDPASTVYVTNKRRACEEVGILSRAYDLPASTTETALLALIDTLNTDPDVDGILVQLPLPHEIRASHVIEHIDPGKDVDGFHPSNLGRLAQRHPALRPCTPYGIMHLLNAYAVPVRGKHAVVVGASNIVGRPMALEFLLAGATVTICHRFTHDPEQHVSAADILVVAVGKQDVVEISWLRPHQTVIDVGMHRLPDGTLRGDVDFAKAKERVAALTPVPGGVGPMTIAMLLSNTLQAAGITPPDY